MYFNNKVEPLHVSANDGQRTQAQHNTDDAL
jgi:hypothetical protein